MIQAMALQSQGELCSFPLFLSPYGLSGAAPLPCCIQLLSARRAPRQAHAEAQSAKLSA